METTNPGTDPKKDSGASSPVVKPENSPDISINFTPKVPITETKTPAIVSLNLQKSDLEKADDSKKADNKPIEAAPAEKKGLLAGLFNKKSAPSSLQTKPSTAWGEALDVPPDKKDFFSSAALKDKSGTSQLVENISTQKAKLEEPKMQDLLGKQSTILEQSIEQEALYKKKKKLRVMQFIAFVIAMIAVAVNGFLYYQLNPGLNVMGFAYNFESNLRNDLFNLNENLRSVQTNLSKYQYLTGQLYLNQFGYESTRFVDSVATLERSGLAASQNAQVESVIEEAKTRMPALLAGAKTNLTEPLVVETYTTRGEEATDANATELSFQNKLRSAINSEKLALKDSGSSNSQNVAVAELAFFDNTIKLVGNRKLQDNLKASTVDAFKLEADEFAANNDPAQRLAFRTFIDNLLASTKVNLATITNLRNSRIKWSEVMDRVEMITNQVNTEHNSGLGSANASLITYASYDFNSETGSISINALNSTRSGTNREVVTYLIEALEASPEFKNVSNRNFPLSKSLDAAGVETFTMNFKISMELERGAFSKMNSPIEDLQSGQKVAITKVPVKRK